MPVGAAPVEPENTIPEITTSTFVEDGANPEMKSPSPSQSPDPKTTLVPAATDSPLMILLVAPDVPPDLTIDKVTLRAEPSTLVTRILDSLTVVPAAAV